MAGAASSRARGFWVALLVALLPATLVLVPSLAVLQAREGQVHRAAAKVREAKRDVDRLRATREVLARFDALALHSTDAEADQHCRRLLLQWAGTANMAKPQVDGQGETKLPPTRRQRSYRLTGTTNLLGVRDMLHAMQIDPVDAGARRVRRVELTPLSAREPEKLRVELVVDWLVSTAKVPAATTRPAPQVVPLARYEPLVDRALFLPYTPPKVVEVPPPAPADPGPRPREPRPPPRPQQRWQLRMVGDLGRGPEAEFVEEQRGDVKRIRTGDVYAGYRVHKIDVARQLVFFRQGNVLFQLKLQQYFSEKRRADGHAEATGTDTPPTSGGPRPRPNRRRRPRPRRERPQQD
jgi:hypothetical protein